MYLSATIAFSKYNDYIWQPGNSGSIPCKITDCFISRGAQTSSGDNLGSRAERLKRLGDQSPPYSARITNEWSYTSSAPYIFMALTETAVPLPYSRGRLSYTDSQCDRVIMRQLLPSLTRTDTGLIFVKFNSKSGIN